MHGLNSTSTNGVNQGLLGLAVDVELADLPGGGWVVVRREPGGDFCITLNRSHAQVRSLLWSTSPRVRARALTQLLKKSLQIYLR